MAGRLVRQVAAIMAWGVIQLIEYAYHHSRGVRTKPWPYGDIEN